jgi:hypothetical protein
MVRSRSVPSDLVNIRLGEFSLSYFGVTVRVNTLRSEITIGDLIQILY